MRQVKFKGNPLTITGIMPGITSPDFRVISQNMDLIKFSNFKDKIKVITSFPSLDTPVCDLQVKEFSKIATSLSEDIVIIGISCDLPFAQKRFCEVNEIKNVYIFSDYRFHSFGINFGILIKELKLLARTVFIIDKMNNIRYSEIVEELTDQPDYEKALENLKKVIERQENNWEEIRCCKWIEKGDSFFLDFPFKDNEELKVLLEIFGLIREEKGIIFDFKLYDNKIEVSLPTEKFNVETGNIFERVIY